MKEGQVYNPHGEYTGMDVSNVKDETVYQLRFKGRVHYINIKNMPIKDIEFWIQKFRQARVELEQEGHPGADAYTKLRQAEIDSIKSTEVELTRKLWERQALSADPHEWPGPAPCGGATQEEKDTFEKDLQRRAKEEYEASDAYREQQEKEKDKMKDFFHGKDIGKKLDPEMYREVPQIDREMNRIRHETEACNIGIERLLESEAGVRSIRKLQQDKDFMALLQNIVDILRKPDTYPEGQARYVSAAEQKFQLWLRDRRNCKKLEGKALSDRARIGTEQEFDQFVDELDAKVLKAHFDPPGSEGCNEKDLRNEAQCTNYRKLYGQKPRRIFDKFAGWGEKLLNPKLTIIPSYDEYVAQRDKQLHKERKKRKWYRVLTVFSKVIIGVIVIFYGIIILEIIFATRPLTTYLNGVLGLQ